ncbi:hypothetical protein RN001_012738 [Aquatica leii]|uniref:TBC1 domain family member 30 n=1 Tax=Aquatica leii TaxID=1421715 RepID=A0AAN7S7W7_9COLE|nr:hypothetical protein RN001_012738 [Aquatica leii]
MHEVTKQIDYHISIQREKALHLLALAKETLKKIEQIIEIADALVESTISVRNLEHLEEEVQNHRKFFINLSRCRAIFESEENLDSETRSLHSPLYQKLYQRASVILDKTAGRLQQMSLGASRWTVLEQGIADDFAPVENLQPTNLNEPIPRNEKRADNREDEREEDMREQEMEEYTNETETTQNLSFTEIILVPGCSRVNIQKSWEKATFGDIYVYSTTTTKIKKHQHHTTRKNAQTEKKVFYQNCDEEEEKSDAEVTENICIICEEFGKNRELWLRYASPENNMRFSIAPSPGESGFSQWHSAMRMVAQLAEGIPTEFRRTLWMNLAERHLSSRNVNWLKVERECFSEWSHPADSELGVQIVKDLHRTGCSLFCGVDGQENQALLKRVLLAYARWNKSVGYCQGFNMLAALILQVTEKCETDALKLMIFLIEGVLPESYFADSLRGLSVDMAVFRELLKTRLPLLSRHLDTLQTAAKDGTTSYEPPLTNVFTMQWFLTLFCNCLPQPTVLRVWDLILLEGNEVLLRTALAIWQVLAERILTVRSADEFYCIMGVLTREILEFGIIDGNSLVKAIVSIGPLTELTALREKYLYNINPWNVSSSVEAEVRNKQLKLYGREKLALDISALKKQYSKLKQRQRQAHIIFSAAVARQPPSATPVVAMNHLLLGRNALLTSKRLGPPKGAIPPNRQTTQTTTLLWKDAPRQSSSSSSSDTELCDDPDVPDDVSPTPTLKSSLNSQFLDDNRIECISDNIDLMKFDNTTEESVLLSDETNFKCTSGSETPFDTGKIVVDSAVDNNVNKLEINNIFDTQLSTKSSEMFDFNKYNIQSDSDDDSFEFEKFLENRVRCLKQTSVDEESGPSSSEDLTEIKRTGHVRKNSQRALEIIQENSLILHRILQCQSRLTPSPPVSNEESDNLPKATSPLFNLELSENDSKQTDVIDVSNSQCFNSANIYVSDDPVNKSIAYLSYDSKSTDKIVSDVIDLGQDSTFESKADNFSKNFFEYKDDKFRDEYSYTRAEFPWKVESTLEDTKNELIYSDSDDDSRKDTASSTNRKMDLTLKIQTETTRDETDTKSSYANIFDSDYTKTLDEKYENLILKPNKTTFSETNLGFSGYSSDAKRCATSPISIRSSSHVLKNTNQKSPDDTACNSPSEVSNVKSPTGRIYNPFPVNISSRQNKDVPLRLGLYKKS